MHPEAFTAIYMQDITLYCTGISNVHLCRVAGHQPVAAPHANGTPRSGGSGGSGGNGRHGPPPAAAVVAAVPLFEESPAAIAASLHAESVRRASGLSGASVESDPGAEDIERKQAAVLAAMRLTPDQQKLLLTVRLLCQCCLTCEDMKRR